VALPFPLKPYLKAKEELWKLKNMSPNTRIKSSKKIKIL